MKPLVINTHDDDSNVKTRKRDKIRAFFCLCKSKPKPTKGKGKKASEGISYSDLPGTVQNGSASQPSAKPISAVTQVDNYSGVGNATLPNNTTQDKPASHQVDNGFSGDYRSVLSIGTAQDGPASNQSSKLSSIVAQVNRYRSVHNQSYSSPTKQEYSVPLRPRRSLSVLSQGNSDFLESSQSFLPSIEQNRSASRQSARYPSATTPVESQPPQSSKFVLSSGSVHDESSSTVTQFDNVPSDKQSFPIVTQMDSESLGYINSVLSSATLQDDSTSQHSESSSSIATHAGNELSDNGSYTAPFDSVQEESPPISFSSTTTKVNDDLSADRNSILSSGTQKHDSIAAQDDSEYSRNSKCVLTPTTVQEEPSSQKQAKPSSIVTEIKIDNDYFNCKSTISPGTVQYLSPSLLRQQSRILSEVSSEMSPSEPPIPPKGPRESRTVQDMNAMSESLNTLSPGLDHSSLDDRPFLSRTVQDTYAMDQLHHPSSTISRGNRTPLANNRPVAPVASQPVPSRNSQQAPSVDSQVFPSSDNRSVSSCDSRSIYSCESQFTSNSDIKSAFLYDNQSLPINNNQSIACGDIQPVPSNAKQNTYLPPLPTVAQALSTLPKEQIQSYTAQQTKPPTLDPHSPIGEVLVAAFTSDGRHILTCPHHQGLEQWDSQTGARVPLPHEMTGGVCAFKISPQGAQVATGCFDGSIRLWRGQTYAAERVLLGHTHAISKLVYSPCGRWLVSCDTHGTVRLRDLLDLDDQGEIVETGAGNSIFKDVVFGPAGHEFTALSAGFVRFYDPRNRNPCTITQNATLGNPIRPLDYSQDGLRFVFGSGSRNYSVHVHDPQLDSNFELVGHGHEVVCAAFSPCGKRILSGGRDKTVRLWLDKVDSWSCAAVVRGCSEAITCLAWNPVTPREFVIGCRDGSVQVWRLSGAEAGDMSVRMVWGTDVTNLTSKDTVGFALCCMIRKS
ncbi:protein with putative role during mitosis [Linnemannia hyalina]|uniref:Protein with putative role during mitosis n=1 Tax=Linnemannia hyalina TaxID=64524 RepID=A0A9P7XYR1_9FUNG|nr:protein with putative role during mitosis [Linnemannia hyalina]